MDKGKTSPSAPPPAFLFGLRDEASSRGWRLVVDATPAQLVEPRFRRVNEARRGLGQRA